MARNSWIAGLALAAWLAFAGAAPAQVALSKLPAASAGSGTDIYLVSQGCGGSPPTATCIGSYAITGAQLQTWADAGVSVALAMPAQFTCTGSPVTGSGTITCGWATPPTGSGAVVLATSPSISGPTITSSLTATGLVTNADLANPATTVNGQTCTLGSTCTAAAAAGTLTGSTLAAGVTGSSLTSVGALASGSLASGFTAVTAPLGGTGVASPAAHAVMIAEGASPMTPVAPSTAGAALTSNGASANPSFLTAAGSQTTATALTAPSSTSAYLMGGLAATITPTTSGTVNIAVTASAITTTATAGTGIRYEIYYGTGAAPVNGATLTGTLCGQLGGFLLSATALAVGDVFQPVALNCRVTGLTPGTAYWIDLAQESVGTASAMGLDYVTAIAQEVR